jgi:hypothetical protein
MNSLRDRIFPPPPPRDGLIVRTQFVGSWESQFAGVGRMTAFVTDYLLRFSAALDDVGLNVVYLQRHHLELGLKLTLERAGSTEEAIATGHDLDRLLRACDAAISAGRHSSPWQEFVDSHGPLIRLMDEVDPQSFVFRYPVNKSQQQVARPPLIDLRELERATAGFHRSVNSLVDLFARDEGLDIPAEEHEVAATEIETAIKAIKSSRAAVKVMDGAVKSLHDQIRILPDRGPDAKGAEAIAGREEQLAVADALVPPLIRGLEMIRGKDKLEPIEPDPPPEPPAGPLRNPQEVKQRLDEYIPWVAELVGESAGELGRALRAVYERTETWPGLASHQLHQDIGRFLTRIHPALVEHAAKRASEEPDEVAFLGREAGT